MKKDTDVGRILTDNMGKLLYGEAELITSDLNTIFR